MKSTFGWNTFVTKRTCGGASGYELVQTIFSSKRPPSYGVPVGPRNAACHLRRLLSFSRRREMSGSSFPRVTSRYSFIRRLFCIAVSAAAR